MFDFDETFLVIHLENFHNESKKLLEMMGLSYEEDSLLPFTSKSEILDYAKDKGINLLYNYEFKGYGYKTLCFVSDNEIMHTTPEPLSPADILDLYRAKKEDDYFKLQMELYKEIGKLL